jgi:hypothetical protein
MSDAELSPPDIATLIDYARRKYAEERWPLSPELKEVREALMKLREQPTVHPAPKPSRPYEPSMVAQRMWKGRR